ncbi:hypothetical protein Kisp01_28470 [Kineosporia sp. NBRC 101677]|uniref:hypothetical protein n=1 Tax=Kineosporia sp. NBRC 101677 TaxID=3032197 RepID=UPI0024A5BB7F|nr:hypothetical protein [Kineosporia sp. NBRC 101677]GLY15832.1 hypothetical protein Kisp01_28470 [Kineosporia sp. NBRC 101677]
MNEQTQLEKLRPRTSVDELWPTPARNAAFERILEARSATKPPRRRGRLILAGALAAVLIPTGVGVATAQGLISGPLAEQLSFWSDHTDGAVNELNARRIAQGPGPEPGTVLSVWQATGADGTICYATVFEKAGPLDRPADTTPSWTTSACPTAEQQAMSSFGNLGGGSDGGIHTMVSAAGDAVRAELQFKDGSVREAIAAGANFAFWYQADEKVDPPELVGYDSAGEEVGRVELPNLVTNSHIPS